MHHSTDFAFNGSNSLFNDCGITYISTRNTNMCACFLEIFDDAAGRLLVEAGAADHGKFLGAALHHPFGNAATDAAEAAG